MISILFVDDEMYILDAIRDSLRKRHQVWNLEFALSGEDALNCLAAQQFDIIVSDMRMPVMDGAALLGKVQEIYPEMMRFILTGHSDQESILRAIPVTHQFLYKPISPPDLLEFLDRAAEFIHRIRNDNVRHLIAQIKSIPSRPKTALKISALLSTSEPSLKEIKSLIEQDPGLAARVIQVANSAFCGRAKEVHDIGDAISFIGLEFIQALAYANEVFAITQENRHLMPLIEAKYDEAFNGSILVSKFLKGHPSSGFATTATLLRDIGLIITATANRTVCDLTMLGRRDGEEALTDLEQEIFGLTHAEVGGHLLSLWGMPMAIVEAVTCHHLLELSTIDPLIMTAIHVADVAAEFKGHSSESFQGFINWEYVDKHGLRNQVKEWLEIAENIFGIAA